MIVTITTVLEPAASPAAPLLGGQGPPLGSPLPAATEGPASRAASGGSADEGSSSAAAAGKPGAAQLDLRFRQRFFALVALLQPYPGALALAALSILESIAVAEVGKIAGSFYKIVVDHQPALLPGTMLHAAALYAACCAIYATGTWLAKGLAVRWRQRLTDHLQRLYCRRGAFYRLQQQVDNPDQRIAFDAAALCESMGEVVKVAAAAPFKVAYYGWLTYGYIGWRGVLAVFGFFWASAALQRLVMAPVARAVWRQEAREGDLRFAHLRLREYAAEAAQYGAGKAEGRELGRALGAAVENQRRLVWLRTGLAATTRGIDYCGALLNYVLVAAAVFAGSGSAGGDGGQLAQWVSNASFATLMLIYSFTELLDLSQHLSSMAGLTARVGQVLEALSAPVEPGAGQQGSQGGASQLGQDDEEEGEDDEEGLACEPLETRAWETQWWQQRWRDVWGWLRSGRGGGGSWRRGYQCLVGSPERHPRVLPVEGEPGRELQPSALADLLVPPTELPAALADSSPLELSIHRLGPDLQREALAIFPGGPSPHPPSPPQQAAQLLQAPEGAASGQQGQRSEEGRRSSSGRSSGPVLAVLTFQFAAGGVSLAPDSSTATLDKAAAEMDRMLDNFLRWEGAVRGALQRAGPYWCDAVDPRSGMALHGRRGAKWSEVAAAHALLGYERREASICPIVLHPRHGTSAYPVSLFTNAPLPALQAAVAAACGRPSWPAALRGAPPSPSVLLPLPSLPAGPTPETTGGALGPREVAEPLVQLQGVTLRRPDGGLAVAGLTLALPPGAHLLISGPNGCGKSTLLRALSGLCPLEAGWAQLGDRVVSAAAITAGGSSGGASPSARQWSPGRPCATAAAAGELSEAAAGSPGRSPQAGQLPLAPPGRGPLCGAAMVVPQRPLAAPGPELWQQLVYPDTRRPPEAELRRLLAAVGLEYLEARAEAAAAEAAAGEGLEPGGGWAAALSPGELQRLSVARVLHRRPAVAILDEVTASVSTEAAVALYGALQAAGIACVSVGQDCAHLRGVHTHHLRLGLEGRSGGAWQLQDLGAAGGASG